ncbi:methionine ABC transporter ATP-binding protein [Bacillus tropicus]|uniref:methionine ABC transporter ATP-binding protein n=1 Tax=Bacillus tropicus TaxID=2026188 RepID=UPI001CFE0EB7|nr:methionine ABC transporter ATP-binding protein [Bacillus tropicus]USK97386.1 methionine ABC transporter ATP-binding protein [Bacillus tropicus]
MISFNNVSKVYESGGQSVHAVEDVTLSVEKGEIFGIIGFSGAGKSTLLRLVNMLERPTAGTISIDDKDITSLSTKELRKLRQRIGMIFQSFNLFNSRTVFGNIAYPLKLAKVPKNEIKERVNELLKFVGLEDKANNYPEQLSGGQKQRVGIARALATSPDILICDEATSALDPETTTEILNLLKKVNREYNLTILLITHEMHVVKEICHRVAVMENGNVIEEGKLFDVFTQPKTKTTQNFVRSVINDHLPESVLAKIQNGGQIYRLTFTGEETGQPVLSYITKNYNVDVNVLYGNIIELQNVLFGNLLVELQGEQREIQKALQHLRLQVQLKEVEAHAS